MSAIRQTGSMAGPMESGRGDAPSGAPANTSTAWSRSLGHAGDRDTERAGVQARRAAGIKINVAVDD